MRSLNRLSCLFALAAVPALAQDQTLSMPNPVVMMVILGTLALAPFLLVMMTSFVKISVVLSIMRNAIGTQSAPPNQVITGLALVLTIFIMTPTARQMYNEAGNLGGGAGIFNEANVRSVFDGASKGREPLRRFLVKHCHDRDRVLFMELAAQMERSNLQPGQDAPAAPERDEFRILIPAFVTSELKESFQIGFLIFVPFLIVDLVVANIMLAMGMQMLSPQTIALPFKILLFVMVDGWFLITRGLVLSYA